jgi:hypothetical protein
LNSVAQAAENLLRSRLLLMHPCISEPACAPHSLRASFLQSCDTEVLEEEEDAGADAGGGVAVCAYADPVRTIEATSASDRAFISFPLSLRGAAEKSDFPWYSNRPDGSGSGKSVSRPSALRLQIIGSDCAKRSDTHPGGRADRTSCRGRVPCIAAIWMVRGRFARQMPVTGEVPGVAAESLKDVQT